jgi:methionyl-tRNA formyltransferase
MAEPLRIVFAGTPEFAATQLAALLASAHHVLAVYTQPDRPAGRGRRLRPSPVKRLAHADAIPVHQPETLRDPGAAHTLATYGPDVMVVAAYGLVLPRPILRVPRLGCINVHASLLPRWRGAAPIQHAILAGDRESGISIIQMDQGVDTGPVLKRASCPIHGDDTAGRLHDRLAELGARTLVAVLAELRTGGLRPTPQDDARATYAPRIRKADATIDWHAHAEHIARQVRAFNPWPVARTTLAGEPLHVWTAVPLEGNGRGSAPGTVIGCSKAGIDVAAGHGVLRLLTVQRPGGRALAAAEFLNAHPLAAGERLGPASATG